jgi:hypothetical protein
LSKSSIDLSFAGIDRKATAASPLVCAHGAGANATERLLQSSGYSDLEGSNGHVKSRQLLIGTLLCLTLIGTAGASTKRTNLGALSDADFGIVGNALAFSPSFQDTVHFNRTRTRTSTISGLVTRVRLTSATSNLSNAMGALAGGALTFGKYTFADLAPGCYTVAIFGTAKYLGGYAATYRVAVAAVPEIETWLMLLIGLGLAAYQLHRKQKALGQQVLRRSVEFSLSPMTNRSPPTGSVAGSLFFSRSKRKPVFAVEVTCTH